MKKRGLFGPLGIANDDRWYTSHRPNLSLPKGHRCYLVDWLGVSRYRLGVTWWIPWCSITWGVGLVQFIGLKEQFQMNSFSCYTLRSISTTTFLNNTAIHMNTQSNNNGPRFRSQAQHMESWNFRTNATLRLQHRHFCSDQEQYCAKNVCGQERHTDSTPRRTGQKRHSSQRRPRTVAVLNPV